jgi:hypothetical protein
MANPTTYCLTIFAFKKVLSNDLTSLQDKSKYEFVFKIQVDNGITRQTKIQSPRRRLEMTQSFRPQKKKILNEAHEQNVHTSQSYREQL